MMKMAVTPTEKAQFVTPFEGIMAHIARAEDRVLETSQKVSDEFALWQQEYGNQLDAIRVMNRDLHVALVTSENRCSELGMTYRAQIDALQGRKDRLKAEGQSLRQEMADDVARTDLQIAKLTQENQTAVDDARRLGQESLTASRKEVAALKAELTQISSELTSLQGSIAAAQTQAAPNLEKISKVTAKLNHFITCSESQSVPKLSEGFSLYLGTRMCLMADHQVVERMIAFIEGRETTLEWTAKK
jgi:chromosome segregation ATPase